MIEALAGILGSSGLGAVVGAVGSWLQKREDRAMKKLEFEHDIEKSKLSLQESQMEHEHALSMADKEIDKAQTEGEIASDLKELDAFTESIRAGFKETGIMFVDAIRGLMRPIITCYLLIISTFVAYKVNALVGGLETLPMIQLLSLYSGIINDLMFLTMVAVTWWFGTRPHSKQAR